MKVPFYLVVGKNGSTRTYKSRPSVSFDEIAIAVKLELPDMLFKKPQIQADITIPENAATPQTITAEVADNIKDAIMQSSGMEVKISIINNDTL